MSGKLDEKNEIEYQLHYKLVRQSQAFMFSYYIEMLGDVKNETPPKQITIIAENVETAKDELMKILHGSIDRALEAIDKMKDEASKKVILPGQE